jgi:hypothetical protein
VSDLIATCDGWLGDKKRYGTRDFSPGQTTIFSAVESLRFDAAQVTARKKELETALDGVNKNLDEFGKKLFGYCEDFDRLARPA